MDKNYLRDSEIVSIAKAIGINARPPRGNDYLWAFWNSDRCIAIVSPTYLQMVTRRINAGDDTYELLTKWLREQETRPRSF